MSPRAHLRALFDRQAEGCGRLGSPFMARMLRHCGARMAPGHPDHMMHWLDSTPQTNEVPRSVAALAAAGADATPHAHLWVEAEQSDTHATVRLTLWTGAPDPEIIELGRVSPHGITMDAFAPMDGAPT